MQKNRSIITDYDRKRLQIMIRGTKCRLRKDTELLSKLKAKLDTAKIISQKEAAPYLVTMNCHVCVTDLNTKKDMSFWLVYPENASLYYDKMSIISDIGIEVLGVKTGTEVEITEKNKKRQLQVSNIFYQPEANGHYKL